MSHKAGHIIITSVASPEQVETGDGMTTQVSIDFPVGMEIDERIKKVKKAMLAIDKLEHPGGADEN
jgi:hypothetical protein